MARGHARAPLLFPALQNQLGLHDPEELAQVCSAIASRAVRKDRVSSATLHRSWHRRFWTLSSGRLVMMWLFFFSKEAGETVHALDEKFYDQFLLPSPANPRPSPGSLGLRPQTGNTGFCPGTKVSAKL